MVTRRAPRGSRAMNPAMASLVLSLVLGACADADQGGGQEATAQGTGEQAAQTASQDTGREGTQDAVLAQAGSECWVRGDPAELGNRASPFDSTEVTMDAGTVKVCYSRPRRLDRTIMGSLVPFGEPWRLGANEATAIYVSAPASIGDVEVEPGWYTLYAIPGQEDWQIVVNGATERWGIQIDDEVRADDVGSVTVPVEPTDAPVEMLTMTLESAAANEAELAMEWENTRVNVPIRLR